MSATVRRRSQPLPCVRPEQIGIDNLITPRYSSGESEDRHPGSGWTVKVTPWTRWAVEVCRDAQGRVALRNLRNDLRQNRLPWPTVRQFLVDADLAWRTHKAESPLAAWTLAATSLSMKGPALATSDKTSLARIMRGDDFVRYNVRRSELPYARVERHTRRVLATIGNGPVGRFAKGEMTASRGFAWVTKKTALDNCLRAVSPPEQPNRARNAAGLYEFRDDAHIVLVFYPPGPYYLRRPTALDAGPSLYFCTWPKGKSWGHTVDLDHHSRGLPEAIHESIALTGAFRIRLLGRLKPPLAPCNWLAVTELAR